MEDVNLNLVSGDDDGGFENYVVFWTERTDIIGAL